MTCRKQTKKNCFRKINFSDPKKQYVKLENTKLKTQNIFLMKYLKTLQKYKKERKDVLNSQSKKSPLCQYIS